MAVRSGWSLKHSVAIPLHLLTLALLALVAAEDFTVTYVPKVNNGCQANVTTAQGWRYIDLSKLGKTRFTLTARDNGDQLIESYTLSLCQQINISSCLNQMFIYEKLEKDKNKTCEGLGNISLLKMEHDRLHLHISPGNPGHIRLACSSSEEGTFECDNIPPKKCSLQKGNNFVLSSKLFCEASGGLHVSTTVLSKPSEGAALKPTNGKRDWLKLGPGSIILIVSGSLFLSYLVLGLLHGTGKGQKGLNRLPNSDFWLELPLLVKDGVIFTFGGCSRRHIIYSPIIEDKSTPIADV